MKRFVLILLVLLAGCTVTAPVVAPGAASADVDFITPYSYQGKQGWLVSDQVKANFDLWWPKYGIKLDLARVPDSAWVRSPDGVDGHWWASEVACKEYGEMVPYHAGSKKLP